MQSSRSELYDVRQFSLGDRVRAAESIRNDGTLAGFARGEVIIHKGDIGYVRDIGSYLNRFAVYAVDFLTLGRIVGMRSHEIVADDESGIEKGETSPS